MRQTDIKNPSPADDCPPAHRFGGDVFFRLPSAVDSAQTDSTADSFGSRRLLFVFVFFIIGLFLLSGCNQTFQPIRDNYKAPFSIFGFLDASADTQWVRVAPIRRQISMSPGDVPDMTITVEDMQSGNTAMMYDSLFQLQDGRYVLNAWGIIDSLEPDQSYTLKAKRTDGAESHVTITFPPDFPTPRLRIIESGDIAYLYIEGVEHLITVQVRSLAHVFSESAGWDFVDVFRKGGGYIRPTEPGAYRVLFSYEGVLEGVTGLPRPLPEDLEIEYLHRQIFVASAGPDWKEEFNELNDRVYSLPEVISNVEHGTGYMYGIVSKSIPVKSCYNEAGELIACQEEKPLY